MMSSTWITPNLKQTWVCSATLLNKLGTGMMHGLYSCMQAQIKEPDSDLQMDINTYTWLGASFGIAGIFGQIVSSVMMTYYGRRMTFFMMTIPAVIGMILMGCASHVVLLFLGRIGFGFSVSANSVMGAVAIGEYASPENRGIFLNSKTTCINIGSFFMHVFGQYVHWRTAAYVTAIPFALSMIVSYTWPESPSWLAEQKKFKKSEEAFFWLRGKSDDSSREIQELLKRQRCRTVRMNFADKVQEFFSKFGKRNFLKPAIIIVLASLLLEVGGRHYFPNYASSMVKEMAAGYANPFYYNIVIDLLIIISGIISVILIRVMGVRKLLFGTGSATVLVLFSACISLYLISSDIISISYTWLPLLLFVSFFFFTSLGCTCVPIVLVGEIFPLEHRAFGSSLSGYCISILLSVVLKVIPYMVQEFMIYGAFAILGICMTVCLVALYYLLPETKNRTLEEIEDFFVFGKFRDGEIVMDDDVEVNDNGKK